jgi:hypothetical protein
VTALIFCSPEGIRTLVADLRSQSPGPLDDGAPVFSIPHDLAVIGSEFSIPHDLAVIGTY